MTYKILFFISVVCFSCFSSFGQGKTVSTNTAEPSYKGLIPGKSGKTAVGQTLGPPVRNVSPTLIEYKFTEVPSWWPNAESTERLSTGRAFVQYRDSSATAVVERIELTCETKEYNNDSCSNAMNALAHRYAGDNIRDRLWPDARVSFKGGKIQVYYGAPRFIVVTLTQKDGPVSDQRFAFYSKELYEGAAPKSGCTGSIFGEWETNRGRMIIERVGDLGFKGTYSAANGSFIGRYDSQATILKFGLLSGPAGMKVVITSFAMQQRPEGAFIGEWKDDTGNGTMIIPFELSQTDFSGAWKRSSGNGQPGGKWEGRCVEAKQ
jgi:hypothetical protein